VSYWVIDGDKTGLESLLGLFWHREYLLMTVTVVHCAIHSSEKC
jgi:hypothetical protein